MRITVVGCGSIGSKLAKAADQMDEVKRLYLIDSDKSKAEALMKELNKAVIVESVEEELYHCDLVIEAATQDVAKDVLMKTASRGVDIMLTSVGALVDDDFRNMVFEKAKNCEARIFIPTGALCGMDGLRAASNDYLSKVEIVLTAGRETLAHVKYFQEQGVDVEKINQKMTLYSGPAREAVKLFPRNVNMAATVSILGVGFDKTIVSIIFDPDAKTNKYELVAEGNFGKSVCTTSNVYIQDSPYNSSLSSLATISALKRIIRNEWVGI